MYDVRTEGEELLTLGGRGLAMSEGDSDKGKGVQKMVEKITDVV